MPEKPGATRKVNIDFEPVGKRVQIEVGASLLDAARQAGVELVSLCGGVGLCQGCRLRLARGEASPVNRLEQDALGEADIASGYRLACQTYPESDAKVDLPPESLATPQRLQVEGQEVDIPVDPLVVPADVETEPPALDDLRSDTRRLDDALAGQGLPPATAGLAVLASLSERIRAQGWRARLALRGREVVGLLPWHSQLLGLAVDVGTTKLAAYLMDLGTGQTVAKAGAMNPQVAYGEDVVSRIAYANENPRGREVLQAIVAEALNKLAAELCSQAGASADQIVEAVVVGNTAMHHLFAGLPVQQLGYAPYVPAVSDPLDFPAAEVGLHLATGAHVHLPPNIAGYVGADHVAMLLATGAPGLAGTVVALDIGTNTEITLVSEGRMLTCSCASGPAFEGAHVREGMRAAPGAIERVQIADSSVRSYTIGEQPPVGICGSGILDTMAELLGAGILDGRGAFKRSHSLVSQTEAGDAFLLVPGNKTGHGRDIMVTRKDVNEVQLAKSAIRSGIDILLSEAGLEAGAIDRFIVAGAFGSYISIKSAIRVGMFPGIPVQRFVQVGNAAGMGAKRMLISARERRAAEGIARRTRYVELTVHPSFHEIFVQNMYFRLPERQPGGETSGAVAP
jgi:uncharacterized 2Fe-2S/4Fe-4S cluster protein (DUF4445 family)